MVRQLPPVTGLLAVTAAVVGLSSASSLARAAEAPGAVTAFWRFAAAALVWHALARASRDREPGPHPPPRRRPRVPHLAVACGVLFGLDLAAYFTAANLIAVAQVEFVVALSPLLVLPLAAGLLGERLPRGFAALAALALAGLAAVLLPGSGASAGDAGGVALAALAAGAWAGYVVASRVARQSTATAPFMAVTSTAAAVTVLPIAAATGNLFRLTGTDVVVVLVLTLVTGVIGQGLLAWGQGSVPASTTAVLLLAMPALASGWAWLAFGEALRPVQVLGAAVVLAAVGALLLRRGSRPVAQSVPQPAPGVTGAAGTLPPGNVAGRTAGTPAPRRRRRAATPRAGR